MTNAAPHGTEHKISTGMKTREELLRHPVYVSLKSIARYMDRYYIDGILGLIPGIGDIISAASMVPFAWFSLFVVKSVPLTLAVVNNALRDILIGMIPFAIGDVTDFFYRSNTRSLKMIIGFVENDRAVVTQVNRKALQAAAAMALLIVLIALMAILLVRLGAWLVSLF